MSPMRPKSGARPSTSFEMSDDLKVAGDAVTMGGIEKENVAVGAEPAVAIEQLRLGRRKQRLTGGDGTGVILSDGRQRLEIERIANILEPPEAQRGERVGRGRGRRAVVG